MNVNDIVNPIGDFFYWIFQSILEPIAELPFNPNDLFLIMGFVGLFIWLRFQSKFNKEAASNSDQIK